MKRTTHSSTFWLVSGIILSPFIILALIYIAPILFTVFVALFTFFTAFFAIFFGGAALLVCALIIIQMIMTANIEPR